MGEWERRLQAVVQRVEHRTVRLRPRPDGGDGLGGLPHLRPARRDEVVHPRHPGIDQPAGGLDEAKPLRRNLCRHALDQPHTKNAEEAQPDEQHGNGDGGRASGFLKECPADANAG